MSKIVSIGTAVPAYRHKQMDILPFMQNVFAFNEVDRRKMSFQYRQCGIEARYSVLPDFGSPIDKWHFFPQSENLEPFPTLEDRMQKFQQTAAPLALKAIRNCLGKFPSEKVTHLITVSCTGMSAPGLDLELMDLLQLRPDLCRVAVNFMGCYAVIQALRIADAFCKADPNANVLIISVELCTLHFQKDPTTDNITSSLLFGDGAAAALVSGTENGLTIENFCSAVDEKGRKDMVWELSSSGFLMTLSGYIPDLIEQDFGKFTHAALENANVSKEEITHWCMHPGGKRILEAIHKSLGFNDGELAHSYEVLKEYGNLSSATILFVLKRIMDSKPKGKIFGAACGPGFTMETFIVTSE